MVSTSVAAGNLQSRIELPPAVTSTDEAAALSRLLHRFYASKRAMILVDGVSRAHSIVEELRKFSSLTYWLVWTSVFAKGLVDESMKDFCGIWRGFLAEQNELDFVESCDLNLCFGTQFSGTNSNNYTGVPDSKVTVLFTSTSIKTRDMTFRTLPVKAFLPA